MQTLTTDQEQRDAALAKRNLDLLTTAAPKAAAQAAALGEDARELAQRAEAELAEKVSACRRIETLLEIEARLLRERQHLSELQAIAENLEANARQAAEYYVASCLGDPFATRNFATLTDHMARAAIVAPFIPKMIAERDCTLKQARSEVAELSREHAIDVPALREALRAERAPTQAPQVAATLK